MALMPSDMPKVPSRKQLQPKLRKWERQEGGAAEHRGRSDAIVGLAKDCLAEADRAPILAKKLDTVP
jgi:hypothetical protein